MTIKPFLINPGRANNPPHPQSYGAEYPLSFAEGIGGARKHRSGPIIGRITAAEEKRYNAVKAAGVDWSPGMFAKSTKKMAKKGKSKKTLSAAQLAAQQKFTAMARKRTAAARKARSAAAGTETPRRDEEGNSMAKAKKKRARRRPAASVARRGARRVKRASSQAKRLRTMVGRVVNPKRRRHNTHRYNKNPNTAKGVLAYMVEGAKDGLLVVVGRGVTKMVAQKIPIPQTSIVASAAVQLAVGLGLAMAVRKITKSDRHASMFLAGAYSNVIQSALAPLPVIGPILSGVSSWPRMDAGIMSSWPRAITPPSEKTNVMYGNTVGLSQPWGYDDPNLSDGIFS